MAILLAFGALGGAFIVWMFTTPEGCEFALGTAWASLVVGSCPLA